MGPEVDKLFLEFSGRPVVAHAWQRFEDAACIDEIILVVRDGLQPHFAELARRHALVKPFRLVPGGAERQDSVWNGLAALAPEIALHAEDKVLKARAFIETRFTDPDLTVDAIAAHVGFSESYFCTVFKQTEGTTVKDWVTRFRIERAKAYLWEKDPPTLADLALKVGFRDPNYFSTVFKRLTGTSPGAYRKKALG